MTEREVRSLPMVALRGMTVMPEMVTHFDVSRERSIEAIEEAMQEEGQKIFLTAQKDIEVEEPTAEDLYQVGTIASIRQIIKLPRNLLRVLISGEERAVINTVEFETPYMRANVTVLPDTGEEALDASADQVSQEAMTRGLKEIYGEYAGRLPKYPKDMLKQVQEYTDLAKVVDWIAANVPLEQKDLQLEDELTKAMEGFYGKHVPANVREFIDLRAGQPKAPAKKRQPRPSSIMISICFPACITEKAAAAAALR